MCVCMCADMSEDMCVCLIVVTMMMMMMLILLWMILAEIWIWLLPYIHQIMASIPSVSIKRRSENESDSCGDSLGQVSM